MNILLIKYSIFHCLLNYACVFMIVGFFVKQFLKTIMSAFEIFFLENIVVNSQELILDQSRIKLALSPLSYCCSLKYCLLLAACISLMSFKCREHHFECLKPSKTASILSESKQTRFKKNAI